LRFWTIYETIAINVNFALKLHSQKTGKKNYIVYNFLNEVGSYEYETNKSLQNAVVKRQKMLHVSSRDF